MEQSVNKGHTMAISNALITALGLELFLQLMIYNPSISDSISVQWSIGW